MGCRISKKQIEILERNTNFNDKEIKIWHKGFIKECPKGRLNVEQFPKIFKDLFPDLWHKKYPAGDIQAFTRHVFRALDKDESGLIDFEEFLKTVDTVLNGTLPRKLNWLFELYDIDRSGTIEAEELESMIEALYEMMGADVIKAKEDARDIFRQIDLDGDGHISKREFIKVCLANKEIYKLLTTGTFV